MSKSPSCGIISTTRNFYSQLLQNSNIISNGWIRGNSIRINRSIRDIESDSMRLFTDRFTLSYDSDTKLELKRIPDVGLFENSKSVFQDVSPSGFLSLTFSHGGKLEDMPFASISGNGKQSHYLDLSEIHGKFISDSWFGGVSWSSDERYLQLL